jgi:hypothetical protein
MMDPALDAKDVLVGFHPDGYRIDTTASPMNRYTKWDILQGNHWCNPRPVCFDSLPRTGWIAADSFEWEDSGILARLEGI